MEKNAMVKYFDVFTGFIKLLSGIDKVFFEKRDELEKIVDEEIKRLNDDLVSMKKECIKIDEKVDELSKQLFDIDNSFYVDLQEYYKNNHILTNENDWLDEVKSTIERKRSHITEEINRLNGEKTKKESEIQVLKEKRMRLVDELKNLKNKNSLIMVLSPIKNALISGISYYAIDKIRN